jgi:hypothetical protein
MPLVADRAHRAIRALSLQQVFDQPARVVKPRVVSCSTRSAQAPAMSTMVDRDAALAAFVALNVKYDG